MTDPVLSARLLRLLASAGSGKTYQLTRRFVSLLQRGAPPGSILASTFTRASAAEIRDRLLAAVAGSGEVDLLRTLIGAIPRLQVRTLDSFFASVVTAFPGQCAVAPDARILEEPERRRLQREAIRAIFAEDHSLEMEQTLSALTLGQADRDIGRAFAAVIDRLHELCADAEAGALDAIGVIPEPDDETMRGAIANLCKAAAETSPQRLAAGLRGEDAAARDWEKFLSNGLPLAMGPKVSLSARDFLGRTDEDLIALLTAAPVSFYKVPVEPRILRVLLPVVRGALASLHNERARRLEAAKELLRRFGRAWQGLLARERAAGFADLTAAAGEILSGAARSRSSAGGDDPFALLAWRLDGRVEHLLLDEFQDTSHAQWRGLEPLAQGLAEDETSGRTVFVVGDLKQSIYRWRGADPEILEHLPERVLPGAPGAMVDHAMSRSYRSAREVLDAVNVVFGSLSANLVMAEARATADRWSGWFAPHEPSANLAAWRGRTELFVSPPVEGDRAATTALADEWLVKQVASAASESPDASIAVLVRTNRVGQRLFRALGPGGAGLPVTMLGQQRLTDAAPVLIVLDALRAADHPGDTRALFNVMSSPLGAALGLPAPSAPMPARSAAEVMARIRAEIAWEGLATVLARWTRSLIPHSDARESERLVQLVELASRRSELRENLSDFVELAANLDLRRRAEARIRILTIHAAKGLEFDHVFLPDLDWLLSGRVERGLFATETDQRTGRVTAVEPWLRAALESWFPQTKSRQNAMRDQSWLESLCLLYVAMTRAARRLSIFIPSDVALSSEPRPRAAHLVWTAMNSAAGEGLVRRVGDETLLTNESEPAPCLVIGEALSPPRRMRAASEVTSNAQRRPAVDRPVPIALAAPTRPRARAAPPASRGSAGSWTDAFVPRSRWGMEVGSLVHEILARAARGEIALDSLSAASPLIPHADLAAHVDRPAEEASQVIGRALACEAIAEILDPLRAWRGLMTRAGLATMSAEHGAGRAEGERAEAARTGGAEVYSEWAFARSVGGAVQIGAIDRLILARDVAGCVRRAEVVDFKTDAIAPEEAAATYRGQLEAYREVVVESFGLPKESVEMRLVLLRSCLVVDLS